MKMRIAIPVLALLVCCMTFRLLVALAADPTPEAKPRLPANALPVPLIAQSTSYSCGAAALLSVLYYWHSYDGNESSLYSLLETTPKDGTHPVKITAGARQLGLTADMRENMTLTDLRTALARKETVIIALQAWREVKTSNLKDWKDDWDNGHYAVLVAMDDNYGYFMDPSAITGYAYVPLPELLERWHDYEDRDSVVWRYFNLGITISGKKALENVPGPLIRMD